MANTTVSVTASATTIFTPTVASVMEPQPITIYNAGAQTVFVTINSTPTAGIGIPVTSTGSLDVTFLANSDVLKGVVTAGTAEVRVMAMRM